MHSAHIQFTQCALFPLDWFIRSFVLLSRIRRIYWLHLREWKERVSTQTCRDGIHDRIEFKPLMRLNDIVFESTGFAVKTTTDKMKKECRLRLCFAPFSYGRHLTPESRVAVHFDWPNAQWMHIVRFWVFIFILFVSFFSLSFFLFPLCIFDLFLAKCERMLNDRVCLVRVLSVSVSAFYEWANWITITITALFVALYVFALKFAWNAILVCVSTCYFFSKNLSPFRNFAGIGIVPMKTQIQRQLYTCTQHKKQRWCRLTHKRMQ